MTTTLWDATLDLSRILTQTYQGTATGGSTSTIIDTSIDEPSSYFGTTGRYGTLWLDLPSSTSDVTRSITAFSSTSTTITFTPALSSTVGVSTFYAAPPDFPKNVLIQSVNQALQEMGPFVTIAEITATVDQQEYDSDDNAIFEKEITFIHLANDTAAPYNWTPHYNWDQQGLTKNALVFQEGYVPQDAYTMRVGYLDNHTPLTSDSQVVDRSVDPNRLKWQSAVHALRWKIAHTRGDEGYWKEMLANAMAMAAKEAARHPISHQKRTRLADW